MTSHEDLARRHAVVREDPILMAALRRARIGPTENATLEELERRMRADRERMKEA